MGSNMRQITNFGVLVGAVALVACTSQPPTVSSRQTVNIPNGYRRVVTTEGQEFFCRSDLDAGSHVQRTTVCLTAAQLKATEENSQNFITNAQSGTNLSGNPTSPAGR